MKFYSLFPSLALANCHGCSEKYLKLWNFPQGHLYRWSGLSSLIRLSCRTISRSDYFIQYTWLRWRLTGTPQLIAPPPPHPTRSYPLCSSACQHCHRQRRFAALLSVSSLSSSSDIHYSCIRRHKKIGAENPFAYYYSWLVICYLQLPGSHCCVPCGYLMKLHFCMCCIPCESRSFRFSYNLMRTDNARRQSVFILFSKTLAM